MSQNRTEVLFLLQKTRIDSQLAGIRFKREKDVKRELAWLVEICANESISKLDFAENLCRAAIRKSGVRFDVTCSNEAFMKPEKMQKFGKGNIYIDWHVDSGSHKLFVTIWQDGKK